MGKLLKPENVLAQTASAETLKQIFTEEPATGKLRRLVERGDLGFEHFDDADLRRLLKRLLEACYWAESPETETHILKSLELAELPRAPDAMKMIRRLGNAGEGDLPTFL